MCDMCNIYFPGYHLSASDIDMELCPNCVAQTISQQTFPATADNCITVNAPRFGGNALVFTDTPQTIERLLGHALLPKEYRQYVKQYSSDIYELHDDFYLDNGIAYQPTNETKYVYELMRYYAGDMDIKPTRQDKENIEQAFLDGLWGSDSLYYLSRYSGCLYICSTEADSRPVTDADLENSDELILDDNYFAFQVNKAIKKYGILDPDIGTAKAIETP